MTHFAIHLNFNQILNPKKPRKMPSSSPTPSPEPSLHESEDSSESYQWNPYVIVPLIIVCVAVLIISYYRVLKQLLCGGNNTTRFSRNSLRTRHLSLSDLQEPSSLEFQSRGLESIIMHSLPITQYKKKIVGEESGECAVCLGDFEEGEWLKHLPVCGHVFHVACIDTWFQLHSNCPICRSCVCDLSRDCSVSMNSLIETLRGEDFFRQTEQDYEILRSEILQNNVILPREIVSSAG